MSYPILYLPAALAGSLNASDNAAAQKKVITFLSIETPPNTGIRLFTCPCDKSILVSCPRNNMRRKPCYFGDRTLGRMMTPENGETSSVLLREDRGAVAILT